MMSIKTSRIRKIDVGTPPSSTTSDSGWEIIQVHYHDFKNLTTTRGEAVVSSEFTCFGHHWSIHVYPGGSTNSGDGKVRISLRNMSNKSIKVQFGFSFRNKGKKTGWSGFVSRETAVNLLLLELMLKIETNGVLTISVSDRQLLIISYMEHWLLRFA